MHAKSLAALATALIMSGSAAAYAQSGNQDYGQASGNRNLYQSPYSGPMMQGNQPAMGRARQRMMLRRELRQAGFENIRILDSAFLVRAQTQDGHQIYMVVNPPGPSAMSMNGSQFSTGSTGRNPPGFNTPTRYGSPRYTPPNAIPQFGNPGNQNNWNDRSNQD